MLRTYPRKLPSVLLPVRASPAASEEQPSPPDPLDPAVPVAGIFTVGPGTMGR